MTMKVDSWNWHDDAWMDTSAALVIEGNGQIKLRFFLRAKPDLDVDKMVTVFDGEITHEISIVRGFFSTPLILNVSGTATLHILLDYPEPLAPGDKREFLGAVCVIDATENECVRRKINLDPNPPKDFSFYHPESEAVASYFDDTFYSNALNGIRNAPNPILDYLVLGWRTGLDPSPNFSTRKFIESVHFDSKSSLSPLGQSIRTLENLDEPAKIIHNSQGPETDAVTFTQQQVLLSNADVVSMVGQLDGSDVFPGTDKFASCLLAIDAKDRSANVFLACHVSHASPPSVQLLVDGRDVTHHEIKSHHRASDVRVWRIRFNAVWSVGNTPAAAKVNVRIGDEDAIFAEPNLQPRIAGNLEVIGDGKVLGWAIDFANTPSTPAKVTLSLGNTIFADARASKPRGDVGRAFPGRERSGFSFQLPEHKLPAGTHVISISVDRELILRSRVTPEISGNRNTKSLPYLPTDRHIAIIVPIYNAPKEVEECMEALLKYTPWVQGRASIFLLDDASPDNKISPLLASYADHPAVTVYRQLENVGYTRNINRGIQMAGKSDVVLLNSDARVGPGWLTGLRSVAAQRDTIGTVTALSDNAGAFSAPVMNVANPPPASMSEEDYARAVRQSSVDITPVVPTGSGFCMYIKREMLDHIGDFDSSLFPRGYGEENEFCLRAIYAGWENVIADSVIVFHERSASFKAAKDTLISEASALLPQLYPEYKKAVRESFLEGSDLKISRYTVALSREKIRPRPRIAFVIGIDSGGTPQTNMDLMSSIHNDFEPWLILCLGPEIIIFRIEGKERIEIERHTLLDQVEPIFHSSSDYQTKITDILQRLKFELVHVRHIIHHGLFLLQAARRLDIPVVFSLHDFYTVCPNIKLLDPEMRHCGGRCTDGPTDCNVEIWPGDAVPVLRKQWVRSWQTRFGNVLRNVDHLVTTSPGARAIVQDIYGKELPPFSVIEHGRDFGSMISLATELKKGEKMRVVVPGSIGDAKGLGLIEAVHKLDKEGRLEFHFVGKQQRPVAQFGINHGTYKREDLPDLISKIAPHVGAVLSIWPETYSHTLTELWSCGLPVIGGGLGATGERIRKHGGGWALDDMSPEAVYASLLRIANDPHNITEQVAAVIGWQEGYGSEYGIAAMAARYRRIYWNLLDRGKPRAHILALHGSRDETPPRDLGAAARSELIERFGSFRINHLSNANPAAVAAIVEDGVDAIVVVDNCERADGTTCIDGILSVITHVPHIMDPNNLVFRGPNESVLHLSQFGVAPFIT